MPNESVVPFPGPPRQEKPEPETHPVSLTMQVPALTMNVPEEFSGQLQQIAEELKTLRSEQLAYAQQLAQIANRPPPPTPKRPRRKRVPIYGDDGRIAYVVEEDMTDG